MTQLALVLRTETPEETVRAGARHAEELGYRSFWVNHPPNQDGFGPLAWAAGSTSSIVLGTGVAPVDVVGPESILRRVEETGLPVERYRLGIGSGQAPDPVRLVRRALGELRGRTRARLVIAALGPRMRRLGALEADGVVLNTMTPAVARQATIEIREAAEAAGRPRPTVYLFVPVGLGEAAVAQLERTAELYATFPAYAAHFERSGIRPIETMVRARHASEVAGQLAAWRDTVDEIVVRAATEHRSVDEVAAIVDAAGAW